MDESLATGPEIRSRLGRIVEVALEQKERSGPYEICRAIGEEFESFACILWETTPDTDLTGNPPTGSLFVVAGWVNGGESFAIHDLVLESATGRAVVEQKVQNIEEVDTDPRVVRGTGRDFLQKYQIKSLCALPVSLGRAHRGALTIYRQERRPFGSEEVEELWEIIRLFPGFYRALRSWVGLRFLRDVTKVLRGVLESEAAGALALEHARGELGRVAELVAGHFGCHECSLLLEEGPNRRTYAVVGTTWPNGFEMGKLRPVEHAGLTPWVLARGKPLLLSDLWDLDCEKIAIQQRYPGLRLPNPDDLRQKLDEVHSTCEGEPRAPASYLAVPLLAADGVIGCLRCSIPLQAPHYFSVRDREFLETVAERVTHCWKDVLRRVSIEREKRSWEALVESVSRLNSFVHSELGRDQPDETRIYREALRVAHSAIDGSDVLDIRLLNAERSELAFFEFAGPGWRPKDEQKEAELKQRRFPVYGPAAKSAAAEVVLTGKAYLMKDVARDPHYTRIFERTKRMIIAPIQLEGVVYGVLDVRSSGPEPFPEQAVRMAEILGNQLGLYLFVASAVGRLRVAELALRGKLEEIQRERREQERAFENLTHQLKSPVLLAHRRAQELLESAPSGERVPMQELAMIRGLTGKARRVIGNMRMFVDLAKDHLPEPNLQPLQRAELLKLLGEAVRDFQELVEPKRRLEFRLDRESFSVLRGRNSQVDCDLLQQAIVNLLDNAAKYSYARTQVRVYGGLTGTRRFHITVMSEGLPIRGNETRLCTDRGWRSEAALMTTGEGSGIGLWIVHNIMKAHSGDLVVMPTTAGDLTEVKLVFPIEPSWEK